MCYCPARPLVAAVARSACVLLVLLVGLGPDARAQVRFRDAADQDAFRQWVVILADAQFDRPTPDVTDCAALVRHAVREALRSGTPDWRRRIALPAASGVAPPVRAHVTSEAGTLQLFRVSRSAPPRFAEFADARRLIALNSRSLGREADALRPGDLLYFSQDGQAMPDHVMLFVGRSSLEAEGEDWVVYHTGPSARAGDPVGTSRGEVRKVRLRNLVRHPAARWRPLPSNPRFVGIYRLTLMGS